MIKSKQEKGPLPNAFYGIRIPTTACSPVSTSRDVPAGIHLVIEREAFRRLGFDYFLDKFDVNRVLPKDRLLVHRLEIDRDKKWPLNFRIDAAAALDAEHFVDFEQLHARSHHHFFGLLRRDTRFKFVESDVVNHEALAIRREPGMVQARISNAPACSLAEDRAEKILLR